MSQYVYGISISALKGKTALTKPLKVNLYIIKILATINNMH